MNHYKLAVSITLSLSLSACASLNLDSLNPFSSSEPEQLDNSADNPQQVAAVSDEQLQQMYYEFQQLKTEIADQAALQNQVKQAQMQLQQQAQAIAKLQTMGKQSNQQTPVYSLQIAAAQTIQSAKQAWRAQSRRHLNYLTKFTPEFQKVMNNNRTFYRVKIGRFTNQSEAQQACREFQRIGGKCLVRKKLH